MTDVKSWIESKTIWGIIIALSPVFSNMVGFNISEIAESIVALAGSALAIYGRITASKKISTPMKGI